MIDIAHVTRSAVRRQRSRRSRSEHGKIAHGLGNEGTREAEGSRDALGDERGEGAPAGPLRDVLQEHVAGFEYAHPFPGSKLSPFPSVSATNRSNDHGSEGKARTSSWYAGRPP
jgi:hypothetical protein